mmetsp:Transcript_93331/g.300464  ORF Transcript_93331/g.300464 Transcript_93331/m.300464 type:complete len:139 (-) Transcript_93331:226-642(-)
MSMKVRDLDYVNPRHKLPSKALPPEIRVKLGLMSRAILGENGSGSAETAEMQASSPQCSGIRERLAKGGQSQAVYIGVANVSAVACSGAAGAGTDWVNPRGHAFVRRGTAHQRHAELQDKAKDHRRLASISMCRSRGL